MSDAYGVTFHSSNLSQAAKKAVELAIANNTRAEVELGDVAQLRVPGDIDECRALVNDVYNALYQAGYHLQSEENQDICASLVGRDVFCRVDEIVSYILEVGDRNAPFSIDDIENLYTPERVLPGQYLINVTEEEEVDVFINTYDEEGKEEIIFFVKENPDDPESHTKKMEAWNGGTWEEEEKVWQYLRDNGLIDRNLARPAAWVDNANQLQKEESEMQEIYEWWAVTDWLAQKLRAAGEPVILTSDPALWGRTTTGQSIKIDSVMAEIAQEMGILYGQESSWSKQERQMWRMVEGGEV